MQDSNNFLAATNIDHIPFDEIPRYSIEDENVVKLIGSSKPVVVTDSELVRSALHWDLDYLNTNIGGGLCHVYSTKGNQFKYYDQKKISNYKQFSKPMDQLSIKFSKFVELLYKCNNTSEKVYLQQMLTDTVGPKIVQDYLQFNWAWITKCQSMFRWGALTSNLLLIGMQGNVTPLHYDEQQNMFAQISGHKRFILFPPEQFECFYPYPVAHPCDRQSQVDVNAPDCKRFPKFRKARAQVATIGPGDVLYIPMYWWHHVESLAERRQAAAPSTPPVTISINFWYRGSSAASGEIEYPLSGQQRVSVMRNVEKMMAAALGGADQVGKMLREMVDGRFEDDRESTEETEE